MRQSVTDKLFYPLMRILPIIQLVQRLNGNLRKIGKVTPEKEPLNVISANSSRILMMIDSYDILISPLNNVNIILLFFLL